MKVVHWALNNGSGLNRVATSMCAEENKMGLDSYVCYTAVMPGDPPSLNTSVRTISEEDAKISDIHVIHSHLPDGVKGKTIFIPHGTPEHCFCVAIDQSKAKGYVAGDPFMLSTYRLNNTDATVTFWPRHEFIWKSIAPKADIRCIPMGVDTDFWTAGNSLGKWSGSPSIFTCENQHPIKWALDVVLAFPLISEIMPGVILHLHYLPLDQHRFWYPLINMNGTCFKSYTSGGYFAQNELRNIFCSVDYYISPVRYGDFNSVCLEAKACGCKVISYKGNPYADYWISEGDQRQMASELIDIFSDKVAPRQSECVTPWSKATKEMVKIYESL